MCLRPRAAGKVAVAGSGRLGRQVAAELGQGEDFHTVRTLDRDEPCDFMAHQHLLERGAEDLHVVDVYRVSVRRLHRHESLRTVEALELKRTDFGRLLEEPEVGEDDLFEHLVSRDLLLEAKNDVVFEKRLFDVEAAHFAEELGLAFLLLVVSQPG